MCAKAQVPTATINGPVSVICTDRAIVFSAHGADPGAFLSWNVKPSAPVTLPADTTGTVFTFTTSGAGTYTVRLTVSSGTASGAVTKVFNVFRSPKATFNASLSGQGFPTQLTLTNYSSSSTKNYWIFDNNVEEKDSSATVVRNYPLPGSYTVAALAISATGCSDESFYAFRISDSSAVTLPNIFSPNGDDINDVYRPLAVGISTLNAWVYNRSGVVVASWDQINGFWDGYTTSGEPCVAGIYFVVLEATGFDGKKYKLKGNITLLR